jgi:hypothetical protein
MRESHTGRWRLLREIILKAREVIASHKSRLSEIDSLLARNPKNPSVRSLLQRERETKAEETRRLESLVAEAEELQGVRSLRVLGMIAELEKKYAHEWLQLERLIQRDKKLELPPILPGIFLPPSSLSRIEGNRPLPETDSAATNMAFTASQDYCSIECGEAVYYLTRLAGDIVRVLHDSAKRGRSLSGQEIRQKTGCGRVWDAFRRRDGRKFWKAFIAKTDKDMFTVRLEPLGNPAKSKRNKL